MSPADRAPRSSIASPPGPLKADEGVLDPELVALHAPPQTERLFALIAMAAAVVAALAMIVALRADLAYSLERDQPTDLGHVEQLDGSRLRPNTYVHIRGLPTLARAVRFSRGMGSGLITFPLAGQSVLYVQVEEDSGARSFARDAFSGRLITFAELGGRYEELAQFMAKQQQLPVTGESFLLLADEPPSSYRWSWAVSALCLAFIALDLFFIARWFRPLRT